MLGKKRFLKFQLIVAQFIRDRVIVNFYSVDSGISVQTSGINSRRQIFFLSQYKGTPSI